MKENNEMKIWKKEIMNMKKWNNDRNNNEMRK